MALAKHTDKLQKFSLFVADCVSAVQHACNVTALLTQQVGRLKISIKYRIPN